MEFIGHFKRLTSVQRNTFIACFLGWSLDAFDFFILIFCVSALSDHFHRAPSVILDATFLTLAMRPVGAFLFGIMADKFGRRPTLMLDIIAYSVFELASAFAPTWTFFLITRALFGIAMGGEWGVGAALTFETLPAEGRGFFSGVLQEGYAMGYLLAATVYGTLFHDNRMARDVRRRRAACCARYLHPHKSRRVTRLDARKSLAQSGDTNW